MTEPDDARALIGAGTSEAITCRGLTKRYGDTLALNELDLVVRQGEVPPHPVPLDTRQ